MLKFILKCIRVCSVPNFTCSCLFHKSLIFHFAFLSVTWHKGKLQELLLLWGARFLCFSDTEAPVGAQSQCLVLPYATKSQKFCTVFTSISGNRMCLSKGRHMLKGKRRECWTGHFKAKKDHSIGFSCLTSILAVLRYSDFYHLVSVEDSPLFYF